MADFSSHDFILVTGASSGIGRAIALHLNALGARVLGVARRRDKLESLTAESTYPQNMKIAVFDVSNINEIEAFVAGAAKQHGRFSGFVHSAGIYEITPVHMFDYEQTLRIFNINYFAGAAFLSELIKRKNRAENFSAVFIASIGVAKGCASSASCVSYCASKAALVRSAECMAEDLKKKKIRINCISPGNTRTEMMSGEEGSGFLAIQKEKTMTGDFCDAKDIARSAAFLLSSEASWITGINMIVDGGETL